MGVSRGQNRLVVVALVVVAMVLFLAWPLVGALRGGLPTTVDDVIDDLGAPSLIARDYRFEPVEGASGRTVQGLTIVEPAQTSGDATTFYMVYFDGPGLSSGAAEFMANPAQTRASFPLPATRQAQLFLIERGRLMGWTTVGFQVISFESTGAQR